LANETKATRKETLGTFEKYLTLWIAICIVAGLLVGRFLPQFGEFIDRSEEHTSELQSLS